MPRPMNPDPDSFASRAIGDLYSMHRAGIASADILKAAADVMAFALSEFAEPEAVAAWFRREADRAQAIIASTRPEFPSGARQ